MQASSALLHHIPPSKFKVHRTPSTQRRLYNLVVILATGRVGFGLGSVPEHDSTEIIHIRRRGALDGRSDRVWSQVARSGTGLAGGSANVQLGAARNVLAPGREAGDEARRADIADSVVVELDPLYLYAESVICFSSMESE